ncbi:MAG: hypothetical protein AAF721_30935, partial [Myxococcota bacterium]
MGRSWWCVACILAVACSSDPGPSGSGTESTDGTGADTGAAASGGSSGGSSGASDSTGSIDTTDGGTASDPTTTGDTGTTGEIDEGEFADEYRLAFTQADLPTAVGTAWVDVNIDGASALTPLIPGGDASALLMVPSPSGRWLFVRGGADVAAQGWLVDANAIEAGGTADDWAVDLEVGALSHPVFFADESGAAYVGVNNPSQRVYARTLGDSVGPAVEIQAEASNARSLARGDDELVIADVDLRLTTAPAAVAAASDTQVASTSQLEPITLWLSEDGSAIYAREIDTWWIGEVNAGAPQPLQPLALPPEQGSVQVVLMSAARNRMVTIDYDGLSPVTEPVHAIHLSGAVASDPDPAPLPGQSGVLTGAFPQLSADGEHFYLAAWEDGQPGVAYHVDWTAGAATVEEVAGGDVDANDAQFVLLSNDEQRLFITTKGAERTIVL